MILESFSWILWVRVWNLRKSREWAVRSKNLRRVIYGFKRFWGLERSRRRFLNLGWEGEEGIWGLRRPKSLFNGIENGSAHMKSICPINWDIPHGLSHPEKVQTMKKKFKNKKKIQKKIKIDHIELRWSWEVQINFDMIFD